MSPDAGNEGRRDAAANAALACVSAWAPDAGAVFGSGLAALPDNATVDHDLGYDELGWPYSAVAGHANRLRLTRVPAAEGRELKLALACGRPHRYEGWTDEELARPVRALAACGARRLVLTNACGSLREAPPGAAVVCSEVVDLQTPPTRSTPERLPVCTPRQAAEVVAVMRPSLPARVGVYVALTGPQFETPAEAKWLSRYGDVVGMSAAPEVRAARAAGVACLLLALVVNRSAEVGSHEDVLATAGRLSCHLAGALVPIIGARWPELI